MTDETTRKIALLLSDNLLPGHPDQREDVFELTEQFGKLAPALAAHGLVLEKVRWRDAAEKASDYVAMLPLMVWDYFEGNEADFLSEMARVEAQTLLLNNFHVLRANANKSYLDDLEHSGAPVIPTVTVERVTPTSVERAFEELGAHTAVIKPQVGGGAWRQIKLSKGEALPPREELPPEAALIQPFLPSVLIEGEFSFLYFGGIFSHAVQKQPKAGDYRIQSIYGGRETAYEPSSAERSAARSVLNALDYVPLYARVDLIRGLDDTLKLIELEMIEPYLYLAHAEGEGAENQGAQKFARALVKRLERAAQSEEE